MRWKGSRRLLEPFACRLASCFGQRRRRCCRAASKPTAALMSLLHAGSDRLFLFYCESRKALSPGGDIKYIVSRDLGETWAPPVTIYTHEAEGEVPKVCGARLLVAKDGTWYLPGGLGRWHACTFVNSKRSSWGALLMRCWVPAGRYAAQIPVGGAFLGGAFLGRQRVVPMTTSLGCPGIPWYGGQQPHVLRPCFPWAVPCDGACVLAAFTAGSQDAALSSVCAAPTVKSRRCAMTDPSFSNAASPMSHAPGVLLPSVCSAL